jgi:hypothetical protein
VNPSLYESINFRNCLGNTLGLQELDSPFSKILPLFQRKFPFNGKRAFYLPYGFALNADLVDRKLEKIPWSEIKSFAFENNLDVTLNSIGKLNSQEGIEVAKNSSLDISEGYSSILSNYSRNFKSDLSYQRRRMNMLNVELSVENSIKAVNEFHELLAIQYLRHHKMIFHTRSFYRSLIANNMAELYVARLGSKMIGGLFVLLDGKTVHYSWGARDVSTKLAIHTVLLEFLVINSIRHGRSKIDFGWTPLTDIDLLKYKQKWGTETASIFTHSTEVANPYLDLNQSYQFLRKVYGLLPLSFAKVASFLAIRAFIH